MPNIEAKNVRHDIDLRQNTMSIHSTGRKKSTCCHTRLAMPMGRKA